MGEHTHSDIYKRLNDKFNEKIKGHEDREATRLLEKYKNLG